VVSGKAVNRPYFRFTRRRAASEVEGVAGYFVIFVAEILVPDRSATARASADLACPRVLRRNKFGSREEM
jgi:hypothetical protein